MRIVRIIARLNVGGPARHVAWLTAATARAGHDSVLVTGTVPLGEEDMGYFAASLGVEPVVVPEMSREISPRDAVTVWKLYRLFLRLRPDVVHTHTAKAGTAGRLAGLLYRWLTPSALWGRPRACRFVHTYHGHVFHSYYGAAKTRFFLAVERALARLCTDRIVVISPQQFEEIHERFRVGRRAQFRVVPLGLDTSAFAGWRDRRITARGELVVSDEDTLLVGIVGRLTEIKNHRMFLDAAALYKQSHASESGRVRFVIVGDGHLRGELEAYARALGLGEDDVLFAGSRRDPENFYAALDVVALTSLNEGTPLTLIEAMACERAVAATAVGGVVDLLGARGHGGESSAASYDLCERGLSVAAGDAAGFAAALARLAGDAELRRELGSRGRRHVEENYSVARLVADVTKLYEELVPRDHDAAELQSPANGQEAGRLSDARRGGGENRTTTAA